MSEYLSSYPKVFNFGHAAIKVGLLDRPVVVEEKLDGSQYSFGIREGQILCRSHHKNMSAHAPPKMFVAAAEAVLAVADKLHDGWTYRGEYLSKPKHNVLAYERVPKNNIIIFDIDRGEEDFLSPEEKEAEAERLGFECVPSLAHREIQSSADLVSFLDNDSVLGGTKIEGVVVKAYGSFGRDKKTLMGKYVSEKFKETHRKKKYHAPGKEIRIAIGERLRTEARWRKAVQTLKEQDVLVGEPKDIGPLIKALQADIEEECKAEIMEELWKWGWRDIRRIAMYKFPEWYKQKLLKEQFREVE